MSHLAMALDILIPKHYAKKVITRTECVTALAGIMTEEQARKFIDVLSGKPSHRNANKDLYKKEASQKTADFSDLLVKMSRINIQKFLYMDKMTIKSKTLKRGRPQKVLVYIPSEEDINAILKLAGMISEDVAIKKDDKLQGEFSIWPPMPIEIFKKASDYKDFVMGYQVFQHGEGKYARAQLSSPIGDSPRNARRRAKRLKISVIPNPPILKILREEDEEKLVPKDEEARLQWIANGLCTEYDYIKNSKIDRKRYPFILKGVRRARKTSKTGKVYIAHDQMSTYDPKTSKYYPAEDVVDVEVTGADRCAFIRADYSRCGSYAIGESNPFCKKHADRLGSKSEFNT